MSMFMFSSEVGLMAQPSTSNVEIDVRPTVGEMQTQTEHDTLVGSTQTEISICSMREQEAQTTIILEEHGTQTTKETIDAGCDPIVELIQAVRI